MAAPRQAAGIICIQGGQHINSTGSLQPVMAYCLPEMRCSAPSVTGTPGLTAADMASETSCRASGNPCRTWQPLTSYTLVHRLHSVALRSCVRALVCAFPLCTHPTAHLPGRTHTLFMGIRTAASLTATCLMRTAAARAQRRARRRRGMRGEAQPRWACILAACLVEGRLLPQLRLCLSAKLSKLKPGRLCLGVA